MTASDLNMVRCARLIAIASLAALCLPGCTSLSSPYPTHSVVDFQERVADFREGIALEAGQSRVEGDTTQMRLRTADAHLKASLWRPFRHWPRYYGATPVSMQ